MGVEPPRARAPTEARLVVFGTPLFADNQQLAQSRLNGDLFLNAVGWLVGQEELVSIRSRSVRASRAELTPDQARQRLLPLGAHHPRAADRARHRGLVAAESRREARAGSLVLFLLVAALGAYLYCLEVPQARAGGDEGEARHRRQGRRSPASTSSTPTARSRSRKDDRRLAAHEADRRAGRRRRREEPARHALTDAEVQKTLDEVPADLAAVRPRQARPRSRLTPPRATLPPPIAVGKNTAIGGKTYVRRGDEPKILPDRVDAPARAQQAGEGPARQAAPHLPGRRRDAHRRSRRPTAQAP